MSPQDPLLSCKKSDTMPDMSVSLYRKYRPQNFSEVLDQDHIVKSLESAIKSGNISHAYLFAGSRGTGKTSIARIFAREIGTSPSDIYEIDAASNRGINEAKELIAGVSTLPFDSKYKVYILDEVHMLTKEAWNAFLKTLEEPPAHVVFILATTELHKVPDTVRSRCQVFEFKKPSIEIRSELIEQVAKKEKIKIELPAVKLIARLGDGAFRDTLGVFEKIINHANGKEITVSLITSLTRLPTIEFVNEFIEDLVKGNLQELLKNLNAEFADRDEDVLEHFLVFVIEKIRGVLLFRFALNSAEDILGNMDSESREFLKKLSKEKNIIDSKLLTEFLVILDETKKSSIKTIPLELALMRILGNTAQSA
jgi:DNA polymerase III subunit gamma/tau